MKDFSELEGALEDIGVLIDDAIRNPDRADLVKARIRSKILGHPVAVPVAKPVDDESVEPDDLWENVPI